MKKEDILPQLSTSQSQPKRVKELKTKGRSAGDKEKGKCVHDKVGTCETHGKGVKKVFEPSWLPSTSSDGKKTMVYQKRWVWRCDVLSMRTE